MEKVLNELETTWSAMEFEHDKHSRTGIIVLKASDEVVETLENNQVQLQNMLTSKFIGFFLEQVTVWQKKLSTTGPYCSFIFLCCNLLIMMYGQYKHRILCIYCTYKLSYNCSILFLSHCYVL